jgi:hypothetical protein
MKLSQKLKKVAPVVGGMLGASCTPNPAYAQEVAEEAANYVTYTIDLIPVLLAGAAAFIAYKLIKHFRAVEKSTGSELEYSPDTLISIRGNGNCYINNMKIGGQRVPDIEVKDKVLYLDGAKKRNLGSNCHIYNRGKGVFVDGKFVG